MAHQIRQYSTRFRQRSGTAECMTTSSGLESTVWEFISPSLQWVCWLLVELVETEEWRFHWPFSEGETLWNSAHSYSQVIERSRGVRKTVVGFRRHLLVTSKSNIAVWVIRKNTFKTTCCLRRYMKLIMMRYLSYSTSQQMIWRRHTASFEQWPNSSAELYVRTAAVTQWHKLCTTILRNFEWTMLQYENWKITKKWQLM